MSYDVTFSLASIRYGFHWDTTPGQALLVEVENLTAVTIPRLYVQWKYEQAVAPPQPEPGGELGGGLIFEPELAREGESALSADLLPGRTCRYHARAGTVHKMVRRVAVLPPGQYWISFQSQQTEFARIPGEELGAFLRGGKL